jgi:phage tail-like protein
MSDSGNRTAERRDPLGSYRFRVELSGRPVAEFSECSGLEMTVKVEEVREGGENDFVHRLPGRVEFGNLTLRRGYAQTHEFFEWFRAVFNEGQVERRTVTVSLMNRNATGPIMQWAFKDAFPAKWSGPAFKAAENAIAVESLEIAHRGLIPVGPPPTPAPGPSKGPN